MPHSATTNILTILESNFSGVVEEWLGTQVQEGVKRSDLFSDAESRAQNAELLKGFAKGVRTGVVDEEFNLEDSAWEDLRAVLDGQLIEQSKPLPSAERTSPLLRQITRASPIAGATTKGTPCSRS